VTPFGADPDVVWRRLIHGDTATRWLSSEGDCGSPNQPAGAPATGIRAQGSEPLITMACHAAAHAMSDAQLPSNGTNPDRFGCVIGTSKGGLRSFRHHFRGRSPADNPAQSWQQCFPDAPSQHVAALLGIRGPLLCPVAACATGLVSLIRGADLIRDGACDVVIAGSTDASLLDVVQGSFRRLGVLARNFDDPARGCRPFAADRTGFLIGEGAAVLVLERLDHARSRQARPYAEWTGHGLAADPAGITSVDVSGEALARLISDTLHRVPCPPDKVDYVNLHGTATTQNDLAETRAVRAAFGAAADGVSCSAFKGALGHLLGAAGSVETALTVLAMKHGIVPPTANLLHPDVQCNLDYTAEGCRRRPIDTAMKLSLGFGGHLAAVVLQRPDDINCR